MKALKTKFFVSFVLVFAIGIFIAQGFKAIPANATKKPSLPVFGETYVSATNGGQTDHYLFYFGMFGLAQTLRNADILMLGSSHMEFGLSAKQLALELSGTNKTLSGFNLGVGSAEGLPFARLIIEKHALDKKLALLDVFMGNDGGLSAQAKTAISTDLIGAYIAVSRIWVNYFRDWILDGYLPQIAFDKTTGFQKKRFLQNLVILRDWHTGDIVETWSPAMGELFVTSPPGVAKTLQAGPVLPAGLWLNADVRKTLITHGHDAVVVSIPYQARNPVDEEALASANGLDAIVIDTADVLLWDNTHLTLAGRTLATSRAAELLKNRYAQRLAPPAVSR